MIKRFSANTAGRDFAVGDIHGHFTLLQQALDRVGFDPAVDRLFSVGDLVDRGPECRQVLDWLAKSWFEAVRGNHDDYVCRFDTCDVNNWVYNGGSWFAGLAWDEQREFAAQFRELPIAIEIETANGLVGIFHANNPFRCWQDVTRKLETAGGGEARDLRNYCMWNRDRVEEMDAVEVEGLYRMVVGHTPLQEPMMLGNVIHIDTGGWRKNGRFTLLEIETMDVHAIAEVDA